MGGQSGLPCHPRLFHCTLKAASCSASNSSYVTRFLGRALPPGEHSRKRGKSRRSKMIKASFHTDRERQRKREKESERERKRKRDKGERESEILS